MAHIVDGPRGPHGYVKPGLLKIAQVTGTPILPVGISPEKKWVFNSWDRFMVPKPFSRVTIRFGEHVSVERRLEKDRFETVRRLVEARIEALCRFEDGSGDRHPR
jgi:lysophospholipid acyltransferase (LPLAT)-like uncharacterized protein